MKLGPFELDMSQPNLLIFRFPPEYEQHELEQALAEVTATLQARGDQPFCLMSVVRSKGTSASKRAVLADFVKQNKSVLSSQCRGWALVISNPVIRGAVKAIFWIESPQWPMKTWASEQEAQAWCRMQLEH